MKKISFSTQGNRADIGHLTIYRMLPNRYADAVGPFVFLDHIAPAVHEHRMTKGTGAHPHRGIATLTYLLHGEDEHWDSRGHHALVHSGGVQWMKAGNGIIHDEILNADSQTNEAVTHGFQFWINLPSAIKKEAPAYLSLEDKDIPRTDLPESAGWIKVIAGTYNDHSSPIPSYSEQFLYHLYIHPTKSFKHSFAKGTEAAAFLPTLAATINNHSCEHGEFVEFDREEGSIKITNHNERGLDILLFGGEPYTEPIVAEGPFVMNSKLEIAEAYRDYFAGKYGEIKE